MTATPTSPPGFRDGIEAAAKVCEACAAKWQSDEAFKVAVTPATLYAHDLAARVCLQAASDIRALTPDTLPTGWNTDMGAAPRDGTHILCIDGDGGVFRSRWAQEHEGYWECWCGQPVVYPPKPVAWMPLPPPPSGE